MVFIPILSFLLALGAARATAQTLATNSSSGLTGDSKCVKLMCISATVFPNSTTQYTLSSTGSSSLGWIAMGFGATMANSPMVIIWPNSDGSVTLSQRMATGEVMPTVVSSPPQVASLDMGLSSVPVGSKPSFVFTVSSISPNPSAQPVIWALGSAAPSSASPDATLKQHVDADTFNLDLTLPISSNSTTPATTPVTTPATTSTDDAKNKRYRMIVSHGILCTVGFLGLLPLGVFIARWTRTFTNRWFTAHAVVQAVVSAPIIVAGVAMASSAGDGSQGGTMDQTHKTLGTALCVLYFVQLIGGAVIHWVKPKNSTGRPVQNYGHAALGLLIIALAFWQVRTGYMYEYPEWTSGTVPTGVNTLWIVWVVLIPIFYIAGLALLPRQFKREAYAKAGKQIRGGSVDGESAEGIVYPGYEMKAGNTGSA
ncbi:CBD9-like protein [Athelia psychrophila]|uniref:CBD9-like protein n=1 Tax=Athelia psychrophila TaxID=1759441 RepID=A0A167XM65_9AGAM|nr:CBD9-like protein [Fibularhizoctonia sp. CBS 109695]